MNNSVITETRVCFASERLWPASLPIEEIRKSILAFSRAGKVLPIEEFRQNVQALIAVAACQLAWMAAALPTRNDVLDDDDSQEHEQAEDWTAQ